MSALEPGLYRATVRGVADQIVMLTEARDGWTMTEVEQATWHSLNEVTDARPLIVLDLSAFISDAALVADLRAGMTWGLNNIADQIEAQTRPPRIPEPKHVGSLVMASATGRDSIGVWTKFSEVGLFQWITPGGVIRQWSDLIDPESFPFGGAA